MSDTALVVKVPSYQHLIWPALHALRSLGGSGSKGDIFERLGVQEGYTPAQLGRLKVGGTEGEIRSRLSWALSDLKRLGVIEQGAGRAEWIVTPAGESIERAELVAAFKAMRSERTMRKASAG